MDKELDDKLCKDFPNLYSDRNKSARITCMCWGFPGNGWEPLIRELSAKLEPLITPLVGLSCTCGCSRDKHDETGKCQTIVPVGKFVEKAFPCPCHDGFHSNHPRAIQVKEKYGTLRFYMAGGSTKQMEALIDVAEKKSRVTCEECGAPGDLEEYSGWLHTVCKKHK